MFYTPEPDLMEVLRLGSGDGGFPTVLPWHARDSSWPASVAEAILASGQGYAGTPGGPTRVLPTKAWRDPTVYRMTSHLHEYHETVMNIRKDVAPDAWIELI